MELAISVSSVDEDMLEADGLCELLAGLPAPEFDSDSVLEGCLGIGRWILFVSLNPWGLALRIALARVS